MVGSSEVAACQGGLVLSTAPSSRQPARHTCLAVVAPQRDPDCVPGEGVPALCCRTKPSLWAEGPVHAWEALEGTSLMGCCLWDPIRRAVRGF